MGSSGNSVAQRTVVAAGRGNLVPAPLVWDVITAPKGSPLSLRLGCGCPHRTVRCGRNGGSAASQDPFSWASVRLASGSRGSRMDDLATGGTAETLRDASPLGSTLSRLFLGFFCLSLEPRGPLDSGSLFPKWTSRLVGVALKCVHSGRLFKITIAGSRHQKFTYPNLNPDRRLDKLWYGKFC